MRTRKIHLHIGEKEGVALSFCEARMNSKSLLTKDSSEITCHICMFRYLAMQAPWARGFMDGLRGLASPNAM